MAEKFLITSALPYANGPLHIGHIAGAYLNADIYVRHLRAQGADVLWVCGSDEHGAAITIRAQKEGRSPQEVVDTYHGILKKAFEDFGISFDIYHRTSSDLHRETAQEYFKTLYEKGAFIEKETEQYYDEQAKMFLADRYIIGTCPKCGHADAYGDQCEKCGSSLSPSELVDPRSTLTGAKPVKKKTSHWFLPMDKHEAWVQEWLEKGSLEGKQHHAPEVWKKHVLGQCRSWIEAGLQARAMTRDLNWGVPVPLEQGKDKVLYVWLDAPIGYISATKAWCAEQGTDWKEYWQNEERQLIHFIGKDNIVFHCIIFPIILKEHGDYNLPVNVPANEFLNLEGDKISTSRNHAVWLHEYLEDMPERIDELRYVLSSIFPETKDSEFTWDDYQARVNNELVAILGNFVNRCMVLSRKYYDGKVPSPAAGHFCAPEVQAVLDKNEGDLDQSIREHKFREALQIAMQGARVGNKFLADKEPWKLVKTEPEAVKGILFDALRLVQHLSKVLRPFLPTTAEKISAMIDPSGANELHAGADLGMVQLLFKKVEDAEMDIQREKLKKEPEEEILEMKTEIAFDDFMKLDMRIGEILSAEKVKGADKLLQLQVKIGPETRTIVSGIAEHYSPEDTVGRQVTVLCNLAPRKIRGVMSQGMILMAESTEGALSFVSPDKAGLSGSEVR